MTTRLSPFTAFADFALLAVLCGLGAYGGLAVLHQIAPSPHSHIIVPAGYFYGFGYAGAALTVGFGLLQRVLRRSVFRVTGPVGLAICLVLSEAFGLVGLPFIIGWRAYRLVAAVRG